MLWSLILAAALGAATPAAPTPKPADDRFEIRTLQAQYWQMQAQLAEAKAQSAAVAQMIQVRIEKLKASCPALNAETLTCPAPATPAK